MAGFNPDSYLAQKTAAPGGFDPDAYLASKAAPQQSGAQPSFMQTIVASPPGRLIHDALVGPLNQLVVGGLRNINAEVPANAPAKKAVGKFIPGFDPVENTYQSAVSAQRNRPGYAEQLPRQTAAVGRHGFTQEITAPFNSALAGIGGLLTGGVNGMNAAADVQTSAQQGYQQQNPVKASIAQILGGFLAVPEGSSTAAYNAFKTPPPKLSPQDAAREYVSRVLTPSDLAAAEKSAGGKPVISAESTKPASVAIGALARREGATADALAGEMAARNAAAPERILDDFAGSAGIDPRLAQGDIEGYIASGRKTVKPMFDQALAGDKGVWNSDLERLSNRPVVQSAMKSVVEDLKNADIDPVGLGFTAQDPVTGKFIQQPRPTAQAWDMVKKRVGQSIERDTFGKIIPDSISPGNYHVNNASRDITAALRDALPGYGDALDASGDYLSMHSAFKDGQSFILNPKVSAAQVQSHIATLSPSEAQAFKGGIANKLFDLQQNGRLGAKFADAPSIQAKLASALGRDNASTFLKSLGTEKNMANFSRLRVPGAGSPTAEYTAAMADQDANSGLAMSGLQLGADAVKSGPLRAIGNMAVGKAQDAAAAWLTRGMAIPVRDEAGKLLMLPPSDLASILSQGSILAGATTAQLPQAATSATKIPYGVIPALASLLATTQPAAAKTNRNDTLANLLTQGAR